MGLLDKLVLPQSFEHIQLLHYMSIVVMFLFVPFFSLMVGGIFISLHYHKKGIKEQNNDYLKFARKLIELTTVNKSSAVILVLVPLVIMILIYSQLLYTAAISSVNLLFISFLFILFGLILIFLYRYSFSLKNIIDSFSSISKSKQNDIDNEVLDDLNFYKIKLNRINYRAGFWGALLLYIASYFFIAALTFAVYPEYWKSSWNLFTIFSSYFVFTKWLQFFSFSFAITGGFILFHFFFWEGGVKDDSSYLDFVRKSALNIVMIFLLIQPLFIGLNLIILPAVSLSTSVFGFVFFALFIIFISYHFIYDMMKNMHLKFSGWIFILIILSMFALTVSDQLSLGNSTKTHSAVLNSKFEIEFAKLKKETSKAGGVSGEEIFKTKCSACHKFDKKVVGPPYRETLSKYQGKVSELTKFINNPKKINPNYPPMPAQGLKPAELKAIATYILEEVKKY